MAHEEFKRMKLEDLIGKMNNAPVLIDVRGMFNGEEAKGKRILLQNALNYFR